MSRSDVFGYLLETYFDNDLEKIVKETGYTLAQVDGWGSGKVIPNKDTIEFVLHRLFTPEFKVISEYHEFDPGEKILPQLRNMLGEHAKNHGIYAFYDSMGNLLYIGKATNLLQESYDSIRRTVHVAFPKGIKTTPEKRYEVVKYISAYDVGTSNWMDYPKHVESLILRLSKPPFNKILGSLEPAYEAERNR